MDFSLKIEKIRQYFKVDSNRGLEKILHLSNGYISGIESGDSSNPGKLLAVLVQQGISSDWFLTGKGEMLLNQAPGSNKTPVNIEEKKNISPSAELCDISSRITNIAERLTQPLMVPSRLQPLVEIATNLDDARLNQVIGSASILYDQQKAELTDSQNGHLSAG